MTLALTASLKTITAQTNQKVSKQNPFTLVHEGAITENVNGKVNIHPVKYKLNGINIAANVYTPPNYDPAKKYPPIVVAHPNGGVKEQGSGCMHNAWRNLVSSQLPRMIEKAFKRKREAIQSRGI
jgi:uncharacterized protein